MPNRAEQNAANPDAVLLSTRPDSTLAAAPARSAAYEGDRTVSEEILSGETPSGGIPKEIGGPTGPEPTRFGDWEKKGRCIDF